MDGVLQMRKTFWRKTGFRFPTIPRFVIVIFIVLVVLGAAFTMFIESFLRPIFLSAAEEKATEKASDAISKAVYEHAKSLKYNDLIHYETNLQGDIILMQPNLQLVNEFTTGVIMTIQENLESLKEEEIRIPIAQALGFQVLAALGPRMSVWMVPMGVVRPPQIIDTFESAGINQTRHKIYMNVVIEVQILVPFVHKRLRVESQVPVTEVTIIGKVPQIYVGMDGGVLQKYFGQ